MTGNCRLRTISKNGPPGAIPCPARRMGRIEHDRSRSDAGNHGRFEPPNGLEGSPSWSFGRFVSSVSSSVLTGPPVRMLWPSGIALRDESSGSGFPRRGE